MQVEPQRRDLDIGETVFLSLEEIAELTINGLLGISGPRFDLVAEPTTWQRGIVLAGDGNARRSFWLAAQLRARLVRVVAQELLNFSENPGC